MARKKKLDDIKQLDGQAPVKSAVTKLVPTTLDQLWGSTGEGKYSTSDIHEYEDSLNEMNLSDLQRHASKMGLLPTNNRDLLKGRLVREFNRHYSKFAIMQEVTEEKPVSKEVARILAEGR